MLPNFIIIGAMKSGTTSLAAYLSDHPEIYISYPKEPGYFVSELNWNKGLTWYESLFEEAEKYKAIGEASTHYTKKPDYQGVEERIKKTLNNPKLIYIMRNPIQRSVSHYWHNVQFHNESRPISKALHKTSEYINYSRYSYQIKEYIELFGEENILFLKHKRLIQNPEKLTEHCFKFLGVDENFIPNNISKIYNKTPYQMEKAVGFVHKIRWSSTWTKIAPFFPKRIKDLAKKNEYRKIIKKDELSNKKIEELKEIFKVDYEFIEYTTNY